MDLPKSTVKEPLKFFQWILDPINFELYRENFFDGFELDPDAITEKESDNVVSIGIFPDSQNNPIEVEITHDFKDNVKELFYSELNSFTENFNTALSDIAFNNNLPIQFLSHLNKMLTEIEQTSKPILERYQFIVDTLQKIKNHIEKELFNFSNNSNLEHKEDLISIATPTTDENNTLIQDEEVNQRQQKADNIFSFLLDYGYMESNDWNQLKEYIYLFMRDFKVPEIRIKIAQPKIRKQELYRLFHKLYFDLEVRGSLDSFSEFIIQTFSGFENRLIKNISKKISSMPKLTKFSEGFPQ